VPGRVREAAQLECHRKYIDIQLVLDGFDEMGWKPLADCHNPVDDYSLAADIQFFHDTPASWIATPPDAFCIFFPEDTHAPLVSAKAIHKVVFKIAANASHQ
jgi:YhcH/YjgK/YiaL family protein